MEYRIENDVIMDPFFSKEGLQLLSESDNYKPSTGRKLTGIVNRNASFEKQVEHLKKLNFQLEDYFLNNIGEVSSKNDVESIKGLMELREVVSYLITNPNRELYQYFANLHDDEVGPETYISPKDFAKASVIKRENASRIDPNLPVVIQLDDKIKDMKLQEKDISHAHLVSKSIADNGYVVEVKDVFNNYPLPISKHLEFVRKRAELGGENIQNVLIPIGLSYNDFKTLTDMVNIKIKPKKARLEAPIIYHAFKTKIKHYEHIKRPLTEQEKSNYNTLAELVNVYDEIDKLATLPKPVTVVFSAGNEGRSGKDYVNLYALNPKALVVGALDENGNIADYSAQTNLVDIFIEPTLPGTSFSAPRALSPHTIGYFSKYKKSTV